LRGRVGATASLDILGKLNPLAKPLALDIQGKVRDLELAPLTPYSVKYTGHGIERGKLSVDVAYLIEPSGQLTATNTLVLNQLTFGEKVEGAPNSLPVKLAVALLADRNGVIDINLPISGSLNDPQFSLGPIIFKVIVNLIVKAITAPFTLLASAFGGQRWTRSWARCPFAARQRGAQRARQAIAGLDRVAKVLADRPVLIMTVVGMASSLDVEREGYKRERLQAAGGGRAAARPGVVAGSTATAAVSVSPAQYPELLKAVYRQCRHPQAAQPGGPGQGHPRVPEMEALLLADIPVTEESHARAGPGSAAWRVRDYLATRQNLAAGAPVPGRAQDHAPTRRPRPRVRQLPPPVPRRARRRLPGPHAPNWR
jgi:hypothetical protein